MKKLEDEKLIDILEESWVEGDTTDERKERIRELFKAKIGKFEREIKEIESQKLPRECASRRITGMFHRKVPNIKFRLDNGEMKEIEILKAKIQFIREEII